MNNNEEILKYASVIYNSTEADKPALSIERSTKVIVDALINKSGDTESETAGINAAVKAGNYGNIKLIDSVINSSGYRADGAFSNDDSGNLEIENTRITVTGEETSGIFAYNSADIHISDSEVLIKSDNSIALKATEHGTIYVYGGEYKTEGENSPVVLEKTYGRVIFGNNAILEADKSNIVVLEDNSTTEIGNALITVHGNNSAIVSTGNGINKIVIDGATIDADENSTIIQSNGSSTNINISDL